MGKNGNDHKAFFRPYYVFAKEKLSLACPATNGREFEEISKSTIDKEDTQTLLLVLQEEWQKKF